MWNPVYHPAIFGWWQAGALLSGHDMVLPLGAPVRIDPWTVPPYGLAVRILYLETIPPGRILDARVAEARTLILARPAWQRWLLPGLAGLVMLGWVLLLGMALGQARKEALAGTLGAPPG